ncbi:MAG: PDZ domain-containing protein [Helicobacteraceae bacterium]|nr:PDZ domain-containing protein [Helicobacteraceae bacterium]
MFKLTLLLTLFITQLFATSAGFKVCNKKFSDSNSIENNYLSVPISKATRVGYSAYYNSSFMSKYDPFLGLYTVKNQKKFEFPFELDGVCNKEVALIDGKVIQSGKVLTKQVGLNYLATFSVKLKAPSIISTVCCNLNALVTSRGLIQKAYLENFLKMKKVVYAEAGFRVKDYKSKVIVTSVTPFMKNLDVKIDDHILTLDSLKILNSNTLMKQILFAKINSTHTFKIKRNKKIKTIKIKYDKRYGGGLIPDTYFEKLGVLFNRDLSVKKVGSNKLFTGLVKGDKLKEINFKKVYTFKNIREEIATSSEMIKLLFDRKGFTFFISIDLDKLLNK